MTDQEHRNKLALNALDYIRAVARVLTEEIEKGFPVSQSVLVDITSWSEDAMGLVDSRELRDLFGRKDVADAY